MNKIIILLVISNIVFAILYFTKPTTIDSDLPSESELVKEFVHGVLEQKLHRVGSSVMKFYLYSLSLTGAEFVTGAFTEDSTLDLGKLQHLDMNDLAIVDHISTHRFSNDCAVTNFDEAIESGLNEIFSEQGIMQVLSCPVISGEVVGALFVFSQDQLEKNKQSQVLNAMLNATDAVSSMVDVVDVNKLRNAK